MSAGILAGLAATVAVAAFVQGCAGVGFALVTAPVAALLYPALLPVGLLVLMLPLNAYVAWRERVAVDRSGAAWITAGRALGTAGGLWLLAAVPARGLAAVVGAATLLAVAATIAAPSFRPRRGAFLVAGAVTGVTETATGVGGPPLALVYQHHPGPTLRATIAVCFVAGEVLSIALLAAAGRVHAEALRAVALLVPALAAGSLASRRFHHRVDGRLLRGVVLAFALASALVVLARAAAGAQATR